MWYEADYWRATPRKAAAEQRDHTGVQCAQRGYCLTNIGALLHTANQSPQSLREDSALACVLKFWLAAPG